ncbi:MAG: hypothetical protein NZ890_03080 [Myxococcota bacterium]|nr:hypothetical protein [Myxococcota bacterium]
MSMYRSMEPTSPMNWMESAPLSCTIVLHDATVVLERAGDALHERGQVAVVAGDVERLGQCHHIAVVEEGAAPILVRVLPWRGPDSAVIDQIPVRGHP